MHMLAELAAVVVGGMANPGMQLQVDLRQSLHRRCFSSQSVVHMALHRPRGHRQCRQDPERRQSGRPQLLRGGPRAFFLGRPPLFLLQSMN